jgi:hypothetical protein
VLKCISELPSPFHQFGLLVALASAWSLTWYQSPRSRVRVLVFVIYCKIAVAPLCVHVLTFSSPVCVHVLIFSSPVWFHVLTFSSPLIRHTWVGVLKCISELPSSFHQFGLLVALASAWSLTDSTFQAVNCTDGQSFLTLLFTWLNSPWIFLN